MPKWLKLVIGILLLPVCLGAASALSRVLSAAGNAQTFWVALVGGAGCWLAIFLLLPKPMLLYVFGHELTHAIWTWLFGGRVKKFKVTGKGGHVVITRSNFLIALAPYFFPLYVVFVILFFILGHLIWNWTRYLPWFHFFIGAAYGFHITLTWHVLKTRQTDITDQGYVFSGVVIWIGNLVVPLIGVPLLTARVSVLNALVWWLDGTKHVLQWLAGVI
ncbi:MAG TPA: M50 family metallopeptidase [Candidatus Acidoferrum sp.]|nr:M50 family metallopeptidase [Candidatus Acidoferrum sp.]